MEARKEKLREREVNLDPAGGAGRPDHEPRQWLPRREVIRIEPIRVGPPGALLVGGGYPLPPEDPGPALSLTRSPPPSLVGQVAVIVTNEGNPRQANQCPQEERCH